MKFNIVPKEIKVLHIHDYMLRNKEYKYFILFESHMESMQDYNFIENQEFIDFLSENSIILIICTSEYLDGYYGNIYYCNTYIVIDNFLVIGNYQDILPEMLFTLNDFSSSIDTLICEEVPLGFGFEIDNDVLHRQYLQQMIYHISPTFYYTRIDKPHEFNQLHFVPI